ncbi:cyanophycinase [Adhaeribacter soli]|uniref:Cyanophycinase n=1 Tax=Adhaeribacter soli TaxID=2607655 RepID=A0A5N1IRU0_9BACT|nr:cyanophycinase [Adhaeribacter soli]KAA9332631.1 cyanophycinase [Adhaeribacter soli]
MKDVKGKLLIIGGHEDKGDYENLSEEDLARKNSFAAEGVLKRFLVTLQKDEPKIEVITTASEIPEEVGEMYQKAFKNLQVEKVGIMHIKVPADANDPEVLERLRKADGLLLSGGDQSRLVSTFSGSKALRIIQERYRDEENFLIAGTSAGAMCMSQVMITGNIESGPMVKGTVHTGTGLGLLNRLIIDTHFMVRRRFFRLAEAVAAFPDHIGVGLDEDSAILISANKTIETIGSGLVVIFNGRQLTKNNFPDILHGDRISLQHIILHILPKGEKLDVTSKLN